MVAYGAAVRQEDGGSSFGLREMTQRVMGRAGPKGQWACRDCNDMMVTKLCCSPMMFSSIWSHGAIEFRVVVKVRIVGVDL
jgi:hypothetical protein